MTKNLKQYAEEMRTMGAMLIDAANEIEQHHDTQLRSVLGALGLAATDLQSVPLNNVTEKIRREYAELPPAQRNQESRLYLARKYSKTEVEVSKILEGPVQNGSLTRK